MTHERLLKTKNRKTTTHNIWLIVNFRAMLIRDEGYGYKPASVVLPRISANSFWDQQPTIETQRDMPQEWFQDFLKKSKL